MTRLTPELLWSIRRVGQPEVAPDGSFVIVPVTDHDIDANEGTTRLYRVAAEGGRQHRPLTAPGADSTAPAISPDGTRLAFVRKLSRKEDGQLYVMPLDGGEPRRLTDLPLGAGAPRWLPDGSGLVFAAPLYEEAPSVEGTRALAAQLADRPVKAVATEDRVYRYWDRWLAGGRLHHLFRIDVDVDGGEPVDLTPDVATFLTLEDPAGSWDIAPDGREIAFEANATARPFDRLQTAVHTVPVDGGAPRRLSAELPASQRRPRYSPDGRHIVFGMQREWDFYADRVRLVRHDRATGAETVLTEEWDRSASAWEFSGDRLVIAAEDRGRINLYTLPLEVAEPAQLVRGGYAHGPRPAGGQVYFRLESLTSPAVVARVPLAGGPPETVADFNAELLAGVEMGKTEEVEFAGADGDTVSAFVVYPPGFDPGRTWPLLHDIHGGPHSISGDHFHYRWNPQVFAAPGYVVVMVNFHGSSSWGQDFAASIHGAWGEMPAADVLAATDHMVERGFIDPDRMAIAGGSYGGYLVAWLIGQTDRFAAAICHAGVTNLVGQYASDITQGRPRSMGATAWEDVAAVQRWSPTNHTAAMTTPTLVIHGEKDYRVVVTQGLELYGILKAKGVPARLVYYPDEGHWILKPQNSLHWYGEFLGWLDRWLS